MLPEAHGDGTAELDPDHPALRDQPDQVTLAVTAGDAVAMDYRLLHGTHANDTGRHRLGVLLNVAPDWAGLPAALRGHLIQHPALPAPGEEPTGPAAPGPAAPGPAAPGPAALEWLPGYDGERRDLPLRRHAPARFPAQLPAPLRATGPATGSAEVAAA